jgi:S1-C subfamily serine protease
MIKSLLLCLVLLAGDALFGQSESQLPAAPKTGAVAQPPEPGPPPVSLNEFSTSLQNLVNKVRPSVVQIYSTGYATSDESDSTTASLLSKQHSTGSGIILSADGYIVTNAHVVRGARRIQVRLPTLSEAVGRNVTMQPEGKLIEAKLVGLDRDIDLAVVKIDKKGLPPLQLGDSNRIQQGELVMAFGSPLGLESSVSMGVVSSTARALPAGGFTRARDRNQYFHPHAVGRKRGAWFCHPQRHREKCIRADPAGRARAPRAHWSTCANHYAGDGQRPEPAARLGRDYRRRAARRIRG